MDTPSLVICHASTVVTGVKTAKQKRVFCFALAASGGEQPRLGVPLVSSDATSGPYRK